MADRIRMRDLLDPAAWEALDRWRDSWPHNSVSIQVLHGQVTLIIAGLYGTSIQRLVTDREPYPGEPQNWAGVVLRALSDLDRAERRAASALEELDRARASALERMELDRAPSAERAWSDAERAP